MRLKATFSETGDKFNVQFQQDFKFNVQFQRGFKSFDARFGQIQHLKEYVGGDPYDGEYAVTPKVEAQTMPTKEKVMLDDVTIRAIPYFDVSNTSGGSTVYIGSEVKTNGN